jgi:hypothetical protein
MADIVGSPDLQPGALGVDIPRDCIPVIVCAMYWNQLRTDQLINGRVVNDNYTCIDQAPFSLSIAAIAVSTDIAILLVPNAMM